MALPGAIWMIFFFYIPVFANVVAFKDFHIDPDGFLASLTNSPWVGFKTLNSSFLLVLLLISQEIRFFIMLGLLH